MPTQRGVTRVGDLPVPVTTFVGRQAQIREATYRLTTNRLVTLLAMGGIGKTRLAEQIARRVNRSVTARWVQLVDLDRGAEPAIVRQAVAEACGVRDSSAGTAWDALVDILSSGQYVLILDNVERVAEQVGALVSALLAAVPTLRIVATSRQPLDCDGEHLLLVPPLSTHEAWELLVHRATSAGVTLTDGDRVVGEQLCQRLDGIPLSIELAARRLRALSPEDLLDAVNDRLGWLAGRRRHGAHPTHVNLRAMVDWSWELCTPAEQTLWARSSVFAEGAGWDLAAATHICTDRIGDAPVDRLRRELLDQPLHLDEATQSTIDGQDVRTVLDGLVDKQIVLADTTHSRTRYRMLDTLRLYGQELLTERGEDTILARRHSRYFRARANKAARSWFSPLEAGWLEWAETNLSNLRATRLLTLTHPDRLLDGIEFAANLARLRTWFFTGSPREGIDWLQQGLAAVAAIHPTPNDSQLDLIVNAHAIAGWTALWQGQSAEPHLTACRTLLDARPPPPHVMLMQGTDLLLTHADPRAVALLAAAGEGFAAAGPDYQGDRHMAELTEATAAAFTGTREQALEATQRCLDNALAAGAAAGISWARLVRGMALTWHGDPDQALSLARTMLARGRATVWAIHAIAWAQAEQITDSDTPGSAATTIAYLLGGADRSRQRSGITLPGLAPFAKATARADSVAQTFLDPVSYATAYQQGATADPAAIFAAALNEQPQTDRQSPQIREPQLWDTLTRAQKEVAQLAIDGLENKTIALRRGVSRRTVESQMAAVLRKLGITNRHQIPGQLPPPMPTT